MRLRSQKETDRILWGTSFDSSLIPVTVTSTRASNKYVRIECFVCKWDKGELKGEIYINSSDETVVIQNNKKV